MTNSPQKSMACAEFQAILPELIGSGADATDHAHYRECELCRALLAELETIAEAARRLFPSVEPPEKLWDQIQIAIEAEEAGRTRE